MLYIQAGAGIVADSILIKEWEETRQAATRGISGGGDSFGRPRQ